MSPRWFTLFVVALSVAAPAFGTTIVAPDTIVQSINHHYTPFSTNPPGSIIIDIAVPQGSPLTMNPALHDRFQATIRAPEGFKFVADAAPPPYDTRLSLEPERGTSHLN